MGSRVRPLLGALNKGPSVERGDVSAVEPLELGRFPTSVELVVGSTGTTGELWVKREASCHPRYGGGKLRKLEWLLAELAAARAERERLSWALSSVGGSGSHHLVALAEHLPAEVEFHPIVFPQQMNPKVRANFGFIAGRATRIWPIARRLALPWAMLSQAADVRRRGLQRWWIGPGGSSPVGSLGFVEAGYELAAQIDAGELPEPRRIWMAAGSAGSGVGLYLGMWMAGVRSELHLVSAVEALAYNRAVFAWKLAGLREWLRVRGASSSAMVRAGSYRGARVPPPRLVIHHDAVGPGYGVATSGARMARTRWEGRIAKLEDTYTAKVLDARDRWHAGRRAEGPDLFWNTHGGSPPDHGEDSLSAHLSPAWLRRFGVELTS